MQVPRIFMILQYNVSPSTATCNVRVYGDFRYNLAMHTSAHSLL